jgi:hypothetical protein
MRKARYFKWLVNKVNAKSEDVPLLHFLFTEEFWWDPSIPTDSSRAEDGIDLRALYFDETDEDFDLDEPCTVLEMLIALALRIERDIMGEPGYDYPERWFWTMIKNLGLSDERGGLFSENYCSNVIENWLSRKYDSNGYGGLFPLKYPHSDQRKIPIWDQMSAYLNEMEEVI